MSDTKRPKPSTLTAANRWLIANHAKVQTFAAANTMRLIGKPSLGKAKPSKPDVASRIAYTVAADVIPGGLYVPEADALARRIRAALRAAAKTERDRLAKFLKSHQFDDASEFITSHGAKP